MFSSDCLFKLSTLILIRCCIFLSVHRVRNSVYISSHASAASSESKKSAARPRKRDPKRVFLRRSSTACKLFSLVVDLLPKEKLIFLETNDTVGSSLESIPINFSNAKTGYATVFAVFYLINLIVRILCSRCALCSLCCFNWISFFCLSVNHAVLL